MKTIQEKIMGSSFITDGGLETDLIFNHGIELPHFAAFPLIERPIHRAKLLRYYTDYLEIAKANDVGMILESPTWRCNLDWGYKLGYTETDLHRINREAILLLQDLRSAYQNEVRDIMVSGCVGPRGDGYSVDDVMTTQQAQKYHLNQITAFKLANADVVSALTMTYVSEAMGIALAAKQKNIPIILSFTVETDGHLPSGEHLSNAIRTIDETTNQYPSYYMINCAHPTHFLEVLRHSSDWQQRILGVRSNASCKSHAELDESTELDTGDKEELGRLHRSLKAYLPNLNVYGGCCGTDVTHIQSICSHVLN